MIHCLYASIHCQYVNTLSIHLYIYIHIYLSIYTSIHYLLYTTLIVNTSIHYLYIYTSIHLYIYHTLSIHLHYLYIICKIVKSVQREREREMSKDITSFSAFLACTLGTVILRRWLSSSSSSSKSCVPLRRSRKIESVKTKTLCLREICKDDYDRKMLDLLAQLTVVGNVSKEFFMKRCEVMMTDSRQRILVVVDTERNKIVATGTLCVEPKFIHQAGLAGHIEDVVVDKDMRSQGLGSEVVRELKSLAREYGCYKAILDCKEHNIAFYEKLGFKCKEVQMALYFPSTETPDEPDLIDIMTSSPSKKCGDGLVVRHLRAEDLTSQGGFLELLAQLTTVGQISPSFLKIRLEDLIKSNRELMFVIEDIKTRRVVAAATLLVEYVKDHHFFSVFSTYP